MNIERMLLEEADLRKLFAAGSADTSLLYLYLRAGNAPENAHRELPLSQNQVTCALATLRQLGLWAEPRQASFVPGERPAYSEEDVTRALHGEGDFRSLYGEVQRQLGKQLNTEELKILLGFNRYLGLPNEVISMLVCYCRERSRRKGSVRNPSLRTIEKEAYAWAEQGIDTLEEAAAFIQARNRYHTELEKLKRLLQIRDRNLSPGEEKFAQAWLDMGFEEASLALAYDRTCLNTGGMNWAYMNKILTRWHEAGLHTVQAIKNGDRKPNVPKGASGELGEAELEAIARVRKKKEEN